MRRLLATSALLAFFAALYAAFLRRPVLEWGSSAEEAAAELPGDELLPDAAGVSTRAITIDAPPSAIWPWLVQMGPAPRGGVYTYDWIENLLGLNMHSADEILEEFQQLETGEIISFGENSMEAALVDPGRTLAWRTLDGNWVWSFNLVPIGAGHTRFISRNRFKLNRLIDRIGMIPMEPASLVMEQKMLQGFKERAERTAATARPAE